MDPLEQQAGAHPERLGDFRLLERLGSGAMGVIYLAEQVSLQRRVALKLVRPDTLYFPEARERFKREIESAARLVHPGIVRVHAHGTQDGLPWFAMEFIEGVALSRALSELSGRDARALSGPELLETARRSARVPPGTDTPAPAALQSDWVRACLWIARELAQALEHAHQHGVLHRDIKPANVMLSAAGRVVLLDFGLARGQGDARLTRTGTRAGSLAYMAPELLRGEAQADTRTDVYSLGVTLFELLALSLPFEEQDEQALTQRALSGRPARLRDRLPWLPQDVETVVAVAMDSEPARRYASAAHLARDLSHLLERQPIEARPPGLALCTRRFVQRNPWGTLAGGLAALALVGGPLGWGWRESRAAERQRELNEQIKARTAQVEAQRLRAEANLDQALEAVDLVLARAGSEQLHDVPGMERVRRDLLTRAVSLYAVLLAQRPGDLARQVDRAIVARQAALAQWELGHVAEAEELYRESVAQHRDAHARDPGSARARISLGHALSNFGLKLSDTGRAAEARPILDEAARVLAAGPDDEPESVDLRLRLGQADHNLGHALISLDETTSALEAFERSLVHFERALELAPQDDVVEWSVIDALVHTAARLGAEGESEPAVRRYRRARALLEARIERRSGERTDQAALERLSLNFGKLLQDLGHAAESEELLQKALERARASASRFPRLVEHRRNVGTLLLNLGVCRALQERYREAERDLREACERLEALAEGQPGVISNVHFRATGLSMLGLVRLEQGDLAEAEACMLRGLELHRELLRSHPDGAHYRFYEAVTRMNLCDLRLKRGELEGVRAELLAVEGAVAGAPRILRNLAGLWARWAERSEQGASLSEELRMSELESGVEQALRVLARAVDGGFNDHEDLAEGELWTLLRGTSAFEALLGRVQSATP